METEEYILFCGHKNGNYLDVFSQWYPSEFKENDQIFKNAEQYMMAKKALLFNDDESYKKIMSMNQPSIIKELGRQVKKFNHVIWDQHKYKIILEGNLLKFSQNPKLMEYLLMTKDKFMAEAAPYDNIYGIGLTAENAIRIPKDEWPGENLLGHALMEVRKEYQKLNKL